MTSDADAKAQSDPPERAAGLLIKPFSLPTMLAEVRRVLRGDTSG